MVLRLLQDGCTAEELQLPYSTRVPISAIKELLSKYSLPIRRGDFKLALDVKDVTFYEFRWYYRDMVLTTPIAYDSGGALRPATKYFHQYGRLFRVDYFHDGTVSTVALTELYRLVMRIVPTISAASNLITRAAA